MNDSMNFHPVADIFPLMSDTEFANLCDDIRANGLREPIWTFRDAIIDGRNRFNACRAVGVEPRFEEWDGIGSLSTFVVSLNLHRRHLNESQRGMVAARIANMRQGERTDIPSIEGRWSQADAAQQLNVSVSSVERASKVLNDGVLDLTERVEAGEISLTAAARVASLPKTKQKRLLAKSDKGKIVNLAQSIKVESTLKKARSTHDLCLVCNPQPKDSITDEQFVAYLTLLAQRVSGIPRRYIQSVLDEIEELGIQADVLEDYELILAAIDAGFQTEADILKFVRRSSDINMGILRYEMLMLTSGGAIEQVPQGGKTAQARGQVKMLWQRKVKQQKPDSSNNRFDEFGDEFDDFEFARPKLSLVA